MPRETPKQYLARRDRNNPYARLLAYLSSHPDASINGFVRRDSGRYAHAKSTHLTLDADDFTDPETGHEGQEDEQALGMVDKLEADMQEDGVEIPGQTGAWTATAAEPPLGATARSPVRHQRPQD